MAKLVPLKLALILVPGHDSEGDLALLKSMRPVYKNWLWSALIKVLALAVLQKTASATGSSKRWQRDFVGNVSDVIVLHFGSVKSRW